MVPELHRSHKSHGSQSHARSNAEESPGCLVRTTVLIQAIPADPLVLPYLTFEPAPGTVAVEAAVWLGAPDAGVGSIGREVRQTGSAESPILVNSDVDTDNDSGESGGEPDGSFTVGPASASPA